MVIDAFNSLDAVLADKYSAAHDFSRLWTQIQYGDTVTQHLEEL